MFPKIRIYLLAVITKSSDVPCARNNIAIV